jgi:hypothetical protein
MDCVVEEMLGIKRLFSASSPLEQVRMHNPLGRVRNTNTNWQHLTD